MFRVFLFLVLALCCLNVVVAADRPEWAFFVPAASPIPKDAWPELSDPLNPPDLYPQEHPPMPEVVARGAQPATGGAPLLPCALCHLPSGAGHVESASLAGLSSNYIAHQLEDIRSGARLITVGDPHAMSVITTLKKGFAGAQISAAARYFSSLKPRPWIRVVAADFVPKSYVSPVSLMRLPVPNGGTEALGRRIVELPE